MVPRIFFFLWQPAPGTEPSVCAKSTLCLLKEITPYYLLGLWTSEQHSLFSPSCHLLWTPFAHPNPSSNALVLCNLPPHRSGLSITPQACATSRPFFPSLGLSVYKLQRSYTFYTPISTTFKINNQKIPPQQNAFPLPVFPSFDVILYPPPSFTDQLLTIAFCFHPSFILSSPRCCQDSFYTISLKLPLQPVTVTS